MVNISFCTITIILLGLISPFLFVTCLPFFQFYLIYSKTNIRVILIINSLILFFWYISFHYYLSLLILSNAFQEFGIKILTLNDPVVLLALLESSLTIESVYRPLFVETCTLLHFVGNNFNIPIVISNIF